MEGTHEVGRRPFMPASTLSGRSVALLRGNLDDCTSEGRLISHGNCTRFIMLLGKTSRFLTIWRTSQIKTTLEQFGGNIGFSGLPCTTVTLASASLRRK